MSSTARHSPTSSCGIKASLARERDGLLDRYVDAVSDLSLCASLRDMRQVDGLIAKCKQLHTALNERKIQLAEHCAEHGC
jgi:hypothetical protein